jgi:hypothetical protein
MIKTIGVSAKRTAHRSVSYGVGLIVNAMPNPAVHSDSYSLI